MFKLFKKKKATATPIVGNDFTELDAYYVGIAPRPDIANEWNLALSEHDKN